MFNEIEKQLEEKEMIIDKEKFIDEIPDEEVKKMIKNLIIEDDENFDKKTWQYLWRFEMWFIEVIDNLEKFNNKKDEENIEKVKNNLMEKIKKIFWKTKEKYEQVKNKIINLYEEIKYKINNDIEKTWNLDYKILKLIEKNLPEYTISYPYGLTDKTWELIKAKMVYIAKRLLDMEENLNDCFNKLIKEYSIEWKYPVYLKERNKITYIKLRYWYLNKKDFEKKLNECYEERKKLEEEFKKLLAEYLFNLWD